MVWRLRFIKGIFVKFLGGGGGWIEVAICDQVSEFDRATCRRPQQHNNQRAYAGSGAGTAGIWGHGFGFMRGFLSIFSAGWGLRHSDFKPRWLNAIKPPGPRQQQYKWPGGIVWAAIWTSPFYHVVIMIKKGFRTSALG